MSGIYFHIPFCKTRCNYCDFYKSTNLSYIQLFVQAIKVEMNLRSRFLNDTTIQTIYFGGGTPSVLSFLDIDSLLKEVFKTFTVNPDVEITLEANPDDLSAEYLEILRTIGINRLSIGIQSFSDADLKLMGRRHNSEQAINAVKTAQKIGFNNISVDLIYGIPGMSIQQWKTNLKTVFDLGIQHLSAYHLTYHENTSFGDKLQKRVILEVEEEDSLLQFEELICCAEDNGFIHYEISNFAVSGFYSKHNTSYWNQTEYLGLGPSAHSFNKKTRYWNISDVRKYLAELDDGKILGETEVLTQNDRFNDYIITGLRTIWGIDIDYIFNEFGEEFYSQVEKVTAKYFPLGKVKKEKNWVQITKNGIFISDQIISDYFLQTTRKNEY
jgi:oxygen-independent coproporphyrinogen III oxidase